MFKQHAKMQYEQEDLHMALKSCNEIGTANTLLMFMLDLQKVSGSKIPMASDVKRIRSDSNFQKFLNSIIVCTRLNNSVNELLSKIERTS